LRQAIRLLGTWKPGSLKEALQEESYGNEKGPENLNGIAPTCESSKNIGDKRRLASTDRIFTKDSPMRTNPYSISLNSRVSIQDLDSGERVTFCLVAPDKHDAKKEKISISTSLGAALVGKRVGNVISWQAPSRTRRFKVQWVSQMS
jgi:transcription elongation GreA/GreB family factor